MRVLWIARRSNQSILKEISPEYSLEGLMLKLKLQYFGHLMQRADSLEKTLMLGKIEGRRRRGQQKMQWLDGITGLMDMNWNKPIFSHIFFLEGKSGPVNSPVNLLEQRSLKLTFSLVNGRNTCCCGL